MVFFLITPSNVFPFTWMQLYFLYRLNKHHCLPRILLNLKLKILLMMKYLLVSLLECIVEYGWMNLHKVQKSHMLIVHFPFLA